MKTTQGAEYFEEEYNVHEHYPDRISGEGNIHQETRALWDRLSKDENSDESESGDRTELPKKSSQISESAAAE